MKDGRLTKKQWAEIAVFCFILGLILFLLHSALSGQTTTTQTVPTALPPQEAPYTPSFTGELNVPGTIHLSPIGVVPLPGAVNHSGCGCDTCSSLTNMDPSIQQIVDNTNNAIATMQRMAHSTVAMIADIGNQSSGGNQLFYLGK